MRWQIGQHRSFRSHTLAVENFTACYSKHSDSAARLYYLSGFKEFEMEQSASAVRDTLEHWLETSFTGSEGWRCV